MKYQDFEVPGFEVPSFEVLVFETTVFEVLGLRKAKDYLKLSKRTNKRKQTPLPPRQRIGSMPRLAKKFSRRQQILESLAGMLADEPGTKITTAGLAKRVGVSEAALYRHFPSKGKMFDGLLDFVDEAVFGYINKINKEEQSGLVKLERTIGLLLGFAEKNRGIACVLNGYALAGECDRVRSRVARFYEKLELQIKQMLREAEMKENIRPNMTEAAASNYLVSFAEGRINQFVRSEFRRSPLEFWPQQWQQLMTGFFRDAVTMPEHSASRKQNPVLAEAGQAATIA